MIISTPDLAAVVAELAAIDVPSTRHMTDGEREAGIVVMLADLTRLAREDGCIAAAWAIDALPALLTAARERDEYKAARDQFQSALRHREKQESILFAEVQALMESRDALTRELAAVREERDAAKELLMRVADAPLKLEILQQQVKPLIAERDAARAEAERLRDLFRQLGEWDCLNPPRPDLLGDLPWLRKLVDAALAGR